MGSVYTNFYENEHLLGTVQEDQAVFLSKVFVCPKCGRAWGRRDVIEGGKVVMFVAGMEFCQDHGNSQMVNYFDSIETLPRAVMEREICYGVQD